MNAKALAATVGGLGLLVLGAGGTIVLGLAWLLGMVEVGAMFWFLPLLAVLGLAVGTYGLAGLASDVIGEADGLREAAQELDWHRLRHIID